MDRHGVRYKIQTDEFVIDGEIKDFIDRFDHILVHFDVDVLDEKFFIQHILLIQHSAATAPAGEG